MYFFFGSRFSQEHVDHSTDRLERLFAFGRDVFRVFLKVGEYAFVFHSEGRFWTVAVIRFLRSFDGLRCRGVACYTCIRTALGPG